MAINEESGNLYRPSRLKYPRADSGRGGYPPTSGRVRIDRKLSGQQLAGQTVLGDEGIYQVQRLFWNAQSFGEQDDRRLRPQPSQFDGDLLPVHRRYGVVQTHTFNRMGDASSSPSPPLGAVRTV